MKREKKRKKRRQYDASFKSDLLKMHEDGRSVSSLAESFGISENLIYRVITALHKVIRSRQPAKGLIVHSDGGGQYGSTAFRALLRA